MIREARQAADDYGRKVEFIQADAADLSFPDDSFDTVVSTLSLCSYRNPEQILTLFHRWCRKGGRILLLEHGRVQTRCLQPHREQ
ncbi:class I SAM-dependent methyltransferase [Brevibacillus humidisoli]|uniref:class I SAM-dependent methyltransferase n=1 Tax=Brevibacillus humidisoli TaxID=2895522 RepID=UPI003B975685